MPLPTGLEQFSKLLIDSYFFVDKERNIVDFNRTFHSMLPRAVARNLKSKKCYEVLQLEICRDRCIAQECWKTGAPVRLDEIAGQVVGETQSQRFILSAIPVTNEQGEIIGAMELQRNVTDEAMVQIKYQQQMEASAKKQAQLELDLQLRTKRLMEVSRRLYQAQKAILSLKTDLFG